MEVLLLVIIGLVAGYFFLKKFEYIDNSVMSSDDKNYESYGLSIVYLSAAVGAILGTSYFYHEIINKSGHLNIYLEWSVIIMLLLACSAMLQAIVFENKISRILGKSVFMIFSCAIAFAVGAVGSVVVICILVLMLILYVIGGALSSSGSSHSSSSSNSQEDDHDATITDEHGYERKLKDNGFGSYRDDKGDYWSKNGDGTVSRDNS